MGFRKNWNAARLALVAVLVAASVATCRCDDSQAEKVYLEGRELAFGLNGADVDEARGFELIEEAAEAGSLDAQATLALMLQRGNGTKIDPARAFETAIIPARRGNPYAQSVLAVCYRTGAGAEWNPKRAETYFKKAKTGLEKLVEEGDPLAAASLAKLYVGTNLLADTASPSDARKAEELLRKADEQGAADGTLGLAFVMLQREEYDEAIKTLRDLAEERDVPGAARALAQVYLYGLGVEADGEKALEWSRRGAEKNDWESCLLVGRCYQLGVDGAPDPEEAVKWYRKAAEGGFALAMTELAGCCERGVGTRQSQTEQKKWLFKAVEYGEDEAMGALAVEYLFGSSDEKDYEKAIKWARRGVELESPTSAFVLGNCYEQGLGVERNLREAVKFYRVAAEQNVNPGVKALALRKLGALD